MIFKIIIVKFCSFILYRKVFIYYSSKYYYPENVSSAEKQ